MKVCHLTSAHDSYDTRIFQKECISLAERGGLEVFLVAPGKSRREKGVTVIGVGDKPENRLKRMTTFTHEVYKAAVSVNEELYWLQSAFNLLTLIAITLSPNIAFG